METFAVLTMFGVRVREVPDLGESALWVEEANLLLVDAGLSREDRESVCCQTLGLLADRPRAL